MEATMGNQLTRAEHLERNIAESCRPRCYHRVVYDVTAIADASAVWAPFSETREISLWSLL